ncbi:signal peptidase I [Sphingomonas sp. SAFR-052]|uniref:signal peptidase I n=1 Tax=Sphingomonas sp. SAFR-052 TaxID=3436867 RepID=UPI003F7E082C
MALDPTRTTPAAPKPKRSEGADLMVFLLKLAIVVFIIRSFLFSPFSIPSGSMQPRLLIGDYLFITKWNYGYSRYSLPWNLPLIPGRILPRTPARGDVVVFKAPPTAKQDYIKRVIGIPGDTVQMRGGQLFLNGKAIPKQRMPDFVVPVSPNTDCAYEFQRVVAEKQVCAYPQYRETLPGGKSYNVLDLGTTEADDTGVFTVPAGHAFLMGDNRDDSADSRFPAREGGGIGIVPLENIEGKAVVNFFSTDGSAQWLLPWTWVSAARWNRIGEGF